MNVGEDQDKIGLKRQDLWNVSRRERWDARLFATHLGGLRSIAGHADDAIRLAEQIKRLDRLLGQADNAERGKAAHGVFLIWTPCLHLLPSPSAKGQGGSGQTLQSRRIRGLPESPCALRRPGTPGVEVAGHPWRGLRGSPGGSACASKQVCKRRNTGCSSPASRLEWLVPTLSRWRQKYDRAGRVEASD